MKPTEKTKKNSSKVSSRLSLGERVPKLRFPGFEGEWEELKIHEIFEVTRGYVLSTKDTHSRPDSKYCYPVYSSQTKDDGLMGYYSEFLYKDAITWTTDGANAGTVHYRTGCFYCTNVCGVLLSNKGYANKCVSEILNAVAKRYVSYVGNPKLMNNVMREIPLVLPNKFEQLKISDFLSLLDSRIAAQRKLVELLKKHKRGVIEQIFRQHLGMGKNSEKWNVVELRDIFSKVLRRNKDGLVKNVITNSAEFGLIPQRDFFDKSIAVEGNTDGYYIIHTGDFVYNPRKSTAAPFGPFNRYTGTEDGIISPLYTCLVPNEKANPEYLAWYFRSTAWHRYVYDNGSQGARHDRVNMTDDLLFGIPVLLPPIAVQEKIAKCLNAIDTRWSSANKALENLEYMKRGLLKQLFV